ARPEAFSLAASAGEEGQEPGMPKKWRRAIVQLGVVAVFSTYKYWRAYHEWIEDWQFELTFADQYRRFLTTEAIRFDSNAYITNWTHVLGGALYYEMARTNYLTWAESIMASFVSSAMYEYVSEWREVISVNDMFLTTFGGYSLGETFFQLSDYFHHRKSPLLKALGFMNPINEFNQWLDRKTAASRTYPEPGWASLVLSAGWRRSSETGRGAFDAGLVGLETQLIRIPEYGRPGTFKKVLRDTSLSELSISAVLRQPLHGDVDLRPGLNQETDLYARVVGLSWYRQSIDELGRGTVLSIGLGSALTYLRKRNAVYDARNVRAHMDPLPETPTDFRDKMTVTHLVGPVVDWTRFGRRLKVRAVADAYVDFALMNAFAFNAYSAVHPIAGMKTTLNYYGYSYVYGGSASGRVDVDWGNLWVRGLFSAHLWKSWEGLDRFENEITNNVNPVDSRTRFVFQAGWRLPSAPVRAFIGVEGIHRWGRIGDVTAASQETRTFTGLSYLF
ncbi:MAG: DUF3943 domain-containing protein, partial [Candidatus Aminicenantales bacterium]